MEQIFIATALILATLGASNIKALVPAPQKKRNPNQR